MLISEFDAENLSKEQINKLLFENIEDDNKAGDCILVFGSSKAPEYRVPKAVEVFKSGRANKLILSGGKIITERAISEAILMKEKAIQLGINEKDILLEEISLTNTTENVLGSMLILNRELRLHRIKRILVVSSCYHLRRCFLTLKTYMPQWIEYSLCPANDPFTDSSSWWKNEVGLKRVSKEIKSLIGSVKAKHIQDYDL